MVYIAVICIVFFAFVIAQAFHKPSITISVDIVPHPYSEEEQADFDKHEYARWIKKANPALDAFLKEFRFVTSENGPYGRMEEEIEASRSRCIDLWYGYWKTQEGISVFVHAKEYMKTYLGSDFEPCMMDSNSLRNRLYYAAELRKLSEERKSLICSELLKIVYKNGSVMRCKLLKMDICDAAYEQIECCYQYLLLKNKLFEHKSGNWYYVSLYGR